VRPIGAEGGCEHWARKLCQDEEFPDAMHCPARRRRGAFHSRTAKAVELFGLDVVLSVGANSVGVHMFRRENAPLAVMTLVSLAILAVFIASS
jgi:hypothetical protein